MKILYCPFCNGIIRPQSKIELIELVNTKLMCTRCGMEFSYNQHFISSKQGREAKNISLEELWN